MRSIVLTHSQIEVEAATETFLLSALTGLDRHCDSLRSCRVHLEGGDASSGHRKPLRITLLLCTGEHYINVQASDWTDNALTARDAIRSVISQAQAELEELKLSNKCRSCCDQ